MSKANPRKAMAALLPLPIKCGSDSAVVRPMTLGMYAALERLGSPLITGEEPKDILDLIPSLYLITHDPREVFRGDLLDQAMAWADDLPVTALADIKSACYRQMNAAFDVIPEDDDTPKKKRRMDRCARPLDGRNLSLELRRDHVGRAALGDRAPQASGRSEAQQDLPPF